LLHESWIAKRSLSPTVSNSTVDEVYEEARAAGALGGKLLGAGGGGFLLLIARPEDQPRIREELSHLIHAPVNFDESGSRVVLYQPNGLN
jgi:D-glycero-alpha-D-manno-heptose-7-phosphate kinase